MKCRRIVQTGNTKTVVWFGSYGIDNNGNALFYSDDKHDNYAEEQQGVADSLTQRLSVIRGELWYAVRYGLPLLEKIRSKVLMDSSVAEIVLQQPDVKSILTFDSSIDSKTKTYSCEMTVESVYGAVDVEI